METRWVKTHCGRQDHGGCALIVGVEGNRIVQVKPDPAGLRSRGYLCYKGAHGAERLTHPDRLRAPLKRTGERGSGQWQEISWAEALDTVAENLDKTRQAHGARAVAFCQGMPKGLEHFVLIRLANVFGSPNVVAVQDVCHAPRELAGVYTCGFYPVADFAYPSRLVVLWGSNPSHTNEEGNICSLLFDQRRQGTELIVIDPRRTELARKATHWLRIKPASDGALALAFLNVIIEEKLYDEAFVARWTHGFDDLASATSAYTPERVADRCWVDADLIRESARLYGKTRPSAIQWGNAIEHNTDNFQTARALVCLMALCGNLDVPGGNVEALDPPLLALGKFVKAELLPTKRKEMIHAFRGTIPRLMTVPPAHFRRAVLEGDPYPVRAAYVQCANPLLSYADSRQTFRALQRLDFLAVSDLYLTPTACLADVVLPAATQFELDDIGHYGIGHSYVLARPKVVDPPEGCWPDLKILNELGKRLTPRELWPEDHRGFLEEVLRPSGLTYEEFAERGHLSGEERFRKYEDRGFSTPSGKVELALSDASKFRLPAVPAFPASLAVSAEYPLVLTCAKDPHYLHSSYRWVEGLHKKSPEPVVQLHPQTGASASIADGDEVVVETASGSIVQVARLNADLHPAVVIASYGWWFPEEGDASQKGWERSNYNVLTSTAELGREFGTPNLKGIACRVRRGP
ncbi:MAG: molybdopterin-dependent oxidoreductase [Deltaproteobacteria bacterium]|nr:molybdopterin-dependent oxidoreductase [Deltaproteobacteria bacterium]